MEPQEFRVRVPQETNKKYHVMRFNAALNVDVTKWKNVRLERENNQRELKVSQEEEAPKFGAGSEFGREAKEEARRRKYGQKKYNPEDQPWLLKVGSKKDCKRFKGLREGGVSENTSYYVFFQASDGAFEAFPVSEWYNFSTVQRFKAFTAEEVEEHYEKKTKILNYFPVMNAKKGKEGDGGDDAYGDDRPRKGRGFKVTDMDEWGSGSEGGDDSDDDEDRGGKKGKGKGKKLGKKKKKGSDDESAFEESDEGDFDQREVDYMSNTSSDDESEPEDERANKEMKGVEDEDGLRQLAMTDSEDEEEEEDKDKKEDDPSEAGKTDEVKVKQEKEDGSDSSGDSDDSDIDDSKFQSGIFMQDRKKKNGSDQSGQTSRAVTPSKELSNADGHDKAVDSKAGIKRKLDAPSGSVSSHIKKPKLNDPMSTLEDHVRRYLVRKPMTTTELLRKCKSKNFSMEKDELVKAIAQVLKKLNPDKQKIKDELHLSLKP